MRTHVRRKTHANKRKTHMQIAGKNPDANPSGESPGDQPVQGSNAVPMRILVVDDDDMLLEFYEAVLSPEHEVLTASNIGTAQLLLQDQPIDAVACDFNLEDANGLDLLVWIQTHQPELLHHTMVLSGDLSPDLGDFHVPVLCKPFNAPDLKQAFKTLLEHTPEETA